MDNTSKDDLDIIFQEGMDEQSFPFKESSWDNMEKMLDAEDKRRNYTIAFFTFIGILSIGFIVYFGAKHFSNKGQIQDTNEVITKNIINESKVNKSQGQTIDQTNNKKDSFDSNKNSDQKNEKVENRNAITPLNIKSNNADPKKDIADLNLAQTFYQENLSVSSSIQVNSNTQIKDIETSISSVDRTTDSSLNKSVLNIDEFKNNNGKIDLELNTSAIPSLALNNLSFETQVKNIDKPSVQDNSSVNRLVYRGLLAYEMSHVPESQNRKTGYKIGAEVGYQFGSKFQISTGLAISLKKYITKGTNYSTVQARIQWVDGVPPETVSGKCTVVEIPLEFTYYLKDYRTNGFFAGAGLNSYFLTNEWYDFNFEPAYQSLNKTFWTTNNNENVDMKRHFLNIVSVQFGYQHQVSNKLAFQFAPYLQLPLTGIGYGDVKLISTGIQFKMSFAK